MSQSRGETDLIAIDRKVLEAFVVDNPELEQLEALLDQFNIFEAIGVVRQELRYSDFLAFLLNPQQNHGLGDAFLKRLLQKILLASQAVTIPVTPVDLAIWSLDQVLVLREWHNIDILLIDEVHRLAVIIENKIDSSEHSDQLRRYREQVQQHYHNWRILGLYLTPDGEQPSDGAKDTYLPVDYGFVCNILESLAESRASTLGRDVLTLIRHYTQMLRRHIVSESDIAELCRRIYVKHKRALDLIYEHRPDQQAIIQTLLKNLIQKEKAHIVLDSHSKEYIRFTVQDWDVPMLLTGEKWTRSGRLLLFEFDNQVDSLNLHLVIGPGPQETRQKLLDMATQNAPLFRRVWAFKKWNGIYQRRFLTSKSYEDTSNDELETEICNQWDIFLETDLPQIRAALQAEQWIWPSANASQPTQ